MAAARTAAGDPQSLADLTHLVASSNGTGVVAIPSPDSLTHAIAQRYRLDLTATYAGHATLVVVNPLEPKADMSEASKAEYEDRAYRLTPGTSGPAVDLDPHAYDLACRVYLAARRSDHAQSITYRSVSLDSHCTFGISWQIRDPPSHNLELTPPSPDAADCREPAPRHSSIS